MDLADVASTSNAICQGLLNDHPEAPRGRKQARNMKQVTDNTLSQSVDMHAGCGLKCRQACLSVTLPRYGRSRHWFGFGAGTGLVLSL